MDKIDPRTGLFAPKTRTEDPKTRKKVQSPPVRAFSRFLTDAELAASPEADGVFRSGELSESAIETLLDEVHEAGAALAKIPSPEHIHQYKNKVGRFIRMIVGEALEVEEKTGRIKKDGSRPKYTLVKVINEKLDKLGAFVLQNQKDKLEILKRIDELNGLLVDLRS